MGTEKESSKNQPKGRAKSSCEPPLAGTFIPCPSVRRAVSVAAQAVSVCGTGETDWLSWKPPHSLAGHPSIRERFITESTGLEEPFEIIGSNL